MPSGRPSGTLFSAQSLLWVSLPPSFALPGRAEAANWSPRGPKGVSGGPRKSPKIDSKSLSVPIGGLRRVGGYPPGACGTPKVHIYAYLCMYFCVFVHIHAYLCMFMAVFMHVHAYLCIKYEVPGIRAQTDLNIYIFRVQRSEIRDPLTPISLKTNVRTYRKPTKTSGGGGKQLRLCAPSEAL